MTFSVANYAVVGSLELWDTAELLSTTPKPLDWLADGVFCRGKLALLGGREKRGKSLLQMGLAVTMAANGGWVAGIQAKAARVLYIDAENGKEEVHRRVHASGLGTAHAHQLLLAGARGIELRRDLGQIAELAEQLEPDVVILDSFRSLWHGKEGADEEIVEALDPLRHLAHDSDRAYCLTHHLRKAGDEYRGSSAIGACVDSILKLEKAPDDPQHTRRRLSHEWCRFAPERPVRWFQIRSGGDSGPVRIEEAEPFERSYDTPVLDDVEAQLVEHIRGCTVSPPYIGEYTSTPPWTGADLARAIGRDPKDRTVRAAIKRLEADGLLRRNGHGRWQRAETLFDKEPDGG